MREIAQVYIDVLTRPRYNLFVSFPRENTSFGCNNIEFIIYVGDDKLPIRFSESKYGVMVMVTRKVARGDKEFQAHFYNMNFSYHQPAKVKRAALILAKKISMKPVYDVMSK